MTYSQNTILCEPKKGERIPVSTLSYFRERNKHRVYDLVMAEFEASGISQAELSRRLRKRPEVVSRMLAAPSNWQLDTISDLLFAISGAEAEYSKSYPLRASKMGRPA